MENDDDNTISRIIFSDEATFYTNGHVNRHNVRIWGTDHPHETVQHEQDSPKVHVFCAVSNDCHMRKVPRNVTNLALPFDANTIMWLHFPIGACKYEHFWMKKCLNGGLVVKVLRIVLSVHGIQDPRTPCDFYLWGYIKDNVYVPPLPTTLDDLIELITLSGSWYAATRLTIVFLSPWCGPCCRWWSYWTFVRDNKTSTPVKYMCLYCNLVLLSVNKI